MKTVLTLCMVVAVVAGCGTISSRLGDTEVGAYPYEGVYTDGKWFADSVGDRTAYSDDRIYGCAAAICSLPFDIIIDTVLLPVDLVCWGCGEHKDGVHPFD